MEASPTQSPTAEPAALDLLGLLWAADHALQVASKRMQATLGVTGRQRVALRLVGREPGISPSALAEGLHIDPSTLTGILTRLEAGGLIRREPHETDRRRSALFLTERGEAIDAVRTGTIEACLERVVAEQPPEAVAACARVLAALTAVLQEDPP
jgi:MarR family transcriptional regulator, organic hydroperoxide resistance regulator